MGSIGASSEATTEASSEPVSSRLRRAPTAGVLLLAVAALVPSAVWLGALRGAAPAAGWPPELVSGAALWRLALAGVGLFGVVRLGLFGSAPRGSAAGEARLAVAEAGGPVLWAILALAAVLRLWGLGSGLWLDEVLTLTQYARLPLGELLTTLDSENQHFAFTVPAHLSLVAFGETAWALRLPAALYGVASLWALWWLGNRWLGRREALLATALMAVSYHHIWFSQNARGYTAALFFSLVATGFFLRARDADGPERTPLWLAYAAAAALGAWSHLTAVFVAFGHAVVYAPRLVRGPRSAAERWLPLVDGFGLAALLTFALYAWGLPQFLGSALAEPSVVGTWKDPLWTLRETLAGLGRGGPAAAGMLAGVAVLAVLGVGAVRSLRDAPELPVLVVVPALLVAASALALGHHLWPRSFFVVTGFVVLLAMRGGIATAEWAAQRVGLPEAGAQRLATAAACLAIAVSAASVPRAWHPKQDFAGAERYVEAQRGSGDSVVVVGLAQYPYGRVYAPHWTVVHEAGELDAIRRRSEHTWVVYTFAEHMAAEHADLLDVIDRDFELMRRFDGTVGDGALIVVRDTGGKELVRVP